MRRWGGAQGGKHTASQATLLYEVPVSLGDGIRPHRQACASHSIAGALWVLLHPCSAAAMNSATMPVYFTKAVVVMRRRCGWASSRRTCSCTCSCRPSCWTRPRASTSSCSRRRAHARLAAPPTRDRAGHACMPARHKLAPCIAVMLGVAS